MHFWSRPPIVLSVSLALVVGCRSAAPKVAKVRPKLLTLEQTVGRGEPVDFSGEAPKYRWSEDGVHLVRGVGEGAVWIDPADWSTTAARPAEKPKDTDLELALAAVGIDPKKEDPPVELAELAPSGDRLAFVQDNDLVLVDVASGVRRAVTQDGGPNVFNGKLDWVYQEEIYGRHDFRAFWLSPDGAHVAFLRLDETAVHEFTVVDHIEEGNFRVKPEVTKYPKAGDPNPTVQLGVVTVDSVDSVDSKGGVRWIDLGVDPAEEPLVVRVEWTPDARLSFQVQDRIQTWLDLVLADPHTGATQRILRETSPAWVERGRSPRWLADGTFLWESERTGQRHVLHYDQAGKLLATITSGPWSVERIDEVDESRGLLWFSATKDGAVNANTYRIRLDGTELTRLTRGDGRHSVEWNGDRSLFLDRFSSLDSPTSVRLCDAEGNVVRELGTAEVPDWSAYLTSPWNLHRVPARDGFELDVAVLLPVPFDPSTVYTVWLPTYSGPDAPSVRNAWNDSTWYQFLAQNGVIVMQVNVRSASGKGLETTHTAYKQLGVQELRDLEDAVDWITRNPWADANRVGITGASYGGFMSAFALTHSDRFALGYAQSGVYDWRMYDTIYTERYMSTPQRNPEGYAATSVIAAAANLRGHLVLTHGVMDDNVHMQNAIQLVYELEKAGKDFELMLYPQSRHGIRDPELRWHDRRLQWRSIQQHLLHAR